MAEQQAAIEASKAATGVLFAAGLCATAYAGTLASTAAPYAIVVGGVVYVAQMAKDSYERGRAF